MEASITRPSGEQIAYELVGRRRLWRPWVVLISGVGHDRRTWSTVLPTLRRVARIVLVDNHGVGQSTPLRSATSVDELANDIVAVLDHAGIRRVHVVGVSLGGMVAQELAIEHPERVRRLVLASTTPGGAAGYPFPLGNALMLWRRILQPGTAGRRRNLQYVLSPATRDDRPDLVEQLSREDVLVSADATSSLLQAAAGTRYSNRGRDRTIAATTLIMHGAHDNVVDPRNAEVLARNIPEARLMSVPDAGHPIFWEQPQLCTRALVQFLRWSSPSAATAHVRRQARRLWAHLSRAQPR
jgi:3-oxoadipate enol-lactonase